MKLSQLEYLPRKAQEGEVVGYYEYCTANQLQERDIETLTGEFFPKFTDPVIIEKGILPQLKMFLTIAEKQTT